MEKRIVKVSLREKPFKCGKCGRMVDIAGAKQRVTETEHSIIYGWDYGHEHKTTFQFISGKPYPIEGNIT